MSWRPAISLEVLRDEVNALWPARNKDSDGMIGDAGHAASASDHNPNPAGVVCAFDITHDRNGPDGTDLAERLRVRRHPDVKYVIWSGRMFSAYAWRGVAPFEWRPYFGPDPHTNHVHVSVGVGPDGRSQPPYDDTDPWLEEQDDMTDADRKLVQQAIDAANNAATIASDVRNLIVDPHIGVLHRLESVEQKVDTPVDELRRNVRRVGRATDATGIEGKMPDP